MTALFRDLLYALRKFRSARVFTATVILTLALGIGGTTAIFTLIHAVMLKSLPVVDPSQLYRIGDGDNCCVQGGPQDRWGRGSTTRLGRCGQAMSPAITSRPLALTPSSAAGLALGLPLAVGAGYLLSAQLYGVSYWDPVALTVAASALATAAFIASVVPASRAAGIAPMKALRTD